MLRHNQKPACLPISLQIALEYFPRLLTAHYLRSGLRSSGRLRFYLGRLDRHRQGIQNPKFYAIRSPFFTSISFAAHRCWSRSFSSSLGFQISSADPFHLWSWRSGGESPLIQAPISLKLCGARLKSVPRGQIEAANSLGLNWVQTIRYVVGPQAMLVALPGWGISSSSALKITSLLAVISVEELTRNGQIIIAATFHAFQIWLLVGIIYLVMTRSLPGC